MNEVMSTCVLVGDCKASAELPRSEFIDGGATRRMRASQPCRQPCTVGEGWWSQLRRCVAHFVCNPRFCETASLGKREGASGLNPAKLLASSSPPAPLDLSRTRVAIDSAPTSTQSLFAVFFDVVCTGIRL